MILAARGIIADRAPSSQRLWLAVGLAWALLMVLSASNAADPFLRHDDFPALLAQPGGFYLKTLEEGRWLNYWWHLRDVVTPAWLNFALYQFLWAAFGTAAAINACGRGAPLPAVLAVALLMPAGVPPLLISGWFNTLIPGMAAVALFALLALDAGPRRERALLLVFVPLSFLAYPVYPVLLLAFCLTRHEGDRPARHLAALLGTFVAAYALGLLTSYGLNWLEHGVFGIEVAAWREPRPAVDLLSALDNLGKAAGFFGDALYQMAWKNLPLLGMILFFWAAGLWTIARRVPRDALYLLAGFAAGAGLIAAQVLKTGIVPAPRTSLFLWVLIILVFARWLALAEGGRAVRLARLALICMAVVFLPKIFSQYQTFTDWQAATRALAAEVGRGPGPVFVTGSVTALPGAGRAAIQEPRALRLRLVYLTGRQVVICEEKPADCEWLGPEQAEAGPVVVAQRPEGTLIRLPAAPD